MKSQKEYDAYERSLFAKQIEGINRQPLADRREAMADWQKVLHEDRPLIAERIGWIFNGSYGYGSYAVAREVIRQPRMNAPAWLCQTIGALEWGVPPAWTARYWRQLPEDERADLLKLINAEIASALAEA